MPFTPFETNAQEALHNSLASDAAAEARQAQAEAMPYTFKLHDMRVLINPTITFNWNDNINLAENGAMEDFIVGPGLQIGASYPVSEQNLLNLNLGGGYNKYLNHDQYSSWFLQSGTEISFDVYVKDFWINLHDRVHYVRGSDQPSQQAQVANTAEFDTIYNTAGLSALWDLNKAKLSAGYDHQNVISGTHQFEYLNGQTELLFVRAGFQVHPRVLAGVEGTASFTHYDQMVFNDNTGYSAGIYADWQAGTHFRLQTRAGLCTYQFQHTSQSIQTSDLNSWYFDVNLTHEAFKAFGYDIDAGHEVNLGVQADAVEDWYFRPGVHWNIFKGMNLTASISYEHGRQGAGNVFGNLTEDYDWCGTGIGASYDFMKHLTLALNYRLTLRSSSAAARSYNQNLISLELIYHW